MVLAVHRETGVPVAVKYLSDSLRTRPGFVRDFRAEARLLAGLESPHVAGLYEYVESPDGAAIVMELVDGVSLRALIARQGPLEPEAALTLLKGSLLGLADAHRLGVVHRDYKPENVLVAPDGTSRLVDFGIAVDSGISKGIAGTPAYMAPEQWTGAPASPAADVYAATATFFECLTRRKPYEGDNFAELALRHLDAPVPAEEVPEPVRGLVRRGLAKDPAERPAHAEEFVRELEAAAASAYGPDWEERGRGRLAALVALLPLLLPSARTAPRTTLDTARTVLGGAGRGGLRAWLPGKPGLAVSAALLLLGVLLAYGGPSGAGADAGEAARVLATTSAGAATVPPSHPETATASPSASSISASPSPSPSVPASATASASPTDPTHPTGPTGPAEPTASAPSAPPAGPASPPAPATPPTDTEAPPTGAPPTTTAPTAVKDVTVTAFQQTGPFTGSATFTVTTDGTGPVSVTVGWFTGDTPGRPGTQDGAAQTLERVGATSYTVTVEHTFQSRGCYWTVQATTTPASADGGASQQLLTRQCELT
ncbi:Serine_threonine-protein kinase PknD [Streptomyces sp. enrichment culture]